MIALTRLDNALRDEPAQLIATVHDEVVLLVPDDLAVVERIGFARLIWIPAVDKNFGRKIHKISILKKTLICKTRGSPQA